MTGKPAFFITTPIYYVNDVPHVGHAYTTTACDVLARFKRLDGYDVRFLTGTDEHGQKVEKAAKTAGIQPQEFCDRVSGRFRELAATLNISNTNFIRTTEDRHTVSSQALWKKLAENGHIYLDQYAGWYSVRDEAFFAEDELTDGPDGEKLSPFGAPVEWVEEASYFFRLSAFQDKLLDYFETHPDAIQPTSRRNEVLSFVRSGLRDLSISRTSFSWGVPVPGDDAHVMYVWIDALTNYITELGYPDWTEEAQRYWNSVVHIVGKDILRFHAVYWPAFLIGAGIDPPKTVFAHGWWTSEGKKMSKSLGNVIDPFALVSEYGVDSFRYFLMREVPFGNDGDFSMAAFFNRVNAELANSFGNLAQRTLSFIAKNCGGELFGLTGVVEPDQAILSEVGSNLLEQMRGHIERFEIHLAIEAWLRAVYAANKYIDEQAPWALRKTDPERMKTVLSVLFAVIRDLAILAQPFVPAGAAKVLDQMAIGEGERSFADVADADWFKRFVDEGRKIGPPQPVFPRIAEAETSRAG